MSSLPLNKLLYRSSRVIGVKIGIPFQGSYFSLPSGLSGLKNHLYMDTNDLTEKAFESLLIAEDIDHMVTVSLGVMCNRLSSEDDFLREAFGYVKALSENPRDFMENWGLLDYLDSWVFSHKMKKLRDYIREVMAIPIENRGMTREEKYYR